MTPDLILVIVALVLAIIAVVDQRYPFLAAAVIGAGTGSSITFTVFLEGEVVAVVKGDGNTDVSALAAQHGLPA